MDVETERLRLRRLEPDDAPDLVEFLNDWEVARWLARPPYPYAAADAEQFIALAQERHERPHPLLFGIAERGSDRLIGVIGVEPDGAGGGEIGYWIGRPFWGCGYGAEAAAATIAAAAAAGLRRLTAFVHPENSRSVRLLRRCRFRPGPTALRNGREGPVAMRRFLLEPLSPGGTRRNDGAPA